MRAEARDRGHEWDEAGQAEPARIPLGQGARTLHRDPVDDPDHPVGRTDVGVRLHGSCSRDWRFVAVRPMAVQSPQRRGPRPTVDDAGALTS
jgi:hypothetical protein